MRRSRAAAPGGPVVIDGFSDLVAIGSGGFSMVYRAHELALDRAVAVKVLNTGLTSERERRDFERECKALGQLNHPDVVTVYRPAFTTDGRPCIVMALYERNFRDQLDAAGPLPPAELLDVGIRMAVALHVAHRRGVLHRDVKPHNIFRSVYGDPALGDFGISTLAGERSHDRSTALSLAYVAPEILDDAAPSAQADVYSLAATLHHLATGRAPFDGKEPSPRRQPGAPRRSAAARPAGPAAELRARPAHGDVQGPGEAPGRRPRLRRGAARGAGPRRPLADDAEAGHRRSRPSPRSRCTTTPPASPACARAACAAPRRLPPPSRRTSPARVPRTRSRRRPVPVRPVVRVRRPLSAVRRQARSVIRRQGRPAVRACRRRVSVVRPAARPQRERALVRCRRCAGRLVWWSGRTLVRCRRCTGGWRGGRRTSRRRRRRAVDRGAPGSGPRRWSRPSAARAASGS